MTSVRSFLIEKRKKSYSKSSNLNLEELEENSTLALKKNGEQPEGNFNILFYMNKNKYFT